MPRITDPPPGAVREDLDLLESALDEAVLPRVLDRRLLIGTWNLRHFGGLTEKRESSEEDSPKRDLQSILTIAEVVRRFDVVALQEVRGDLKALRHTMETLGDDWGLILSDVTRGARGNDERLGFLFDRRTVQPSGLVGELVVPAEELRRIGEGALRRQFARTSHAVAFRCGGETFILVTLHVLWGSSAAERTPELRAIAEWLDEWAREVNAWGHNLIALGDFNIDRRGTSATRRSPRPACRSPRTSKQSRGRCGATPTSPTWTSSTTRSPGSPPPLATVRRSRWTTARAGTSTSRTSRSHGAN